MTKKQLITSNWQNYL